MKSKVADITVTQFPEHGILCIKTGWGGFKQEWRTGKLGPNRYIPFIL